MLAYKKTLEQEIEIEIAALESQLRALAPPAGLTSKNPVYTLEQKNVLRNDFNSSADSFATAAYTRDLPRRQGLERRLDYYRRRLNALRVHRAYAADFSFAA